MLIYQWSKKFYFIQCTYVSKLFIVNIWVDKIMCIVLQSRIKNLISLQKKYFSCYLLNAYLYPRSTRGGGGGGILFYLCLSVRRIFLSNYWWQKSDIWSQVSYRYAILWEAFLDLSDSYFLFADLVGFYTHWTYMRGYHKWALAQ
jgi:hypothetical protein